VIDPSSDPLAGREYVTARPDGLYIDEVRATAIADRYGTPVSVVSLNQVRANLQRWRTALAREWPHATTEVLASFKANTSLALWRHLADVAAGSDVCGEHELRAALHVGIAPERISLNGSTKSIAVLELAVRRSVRITVDSFDELRRVADVARVLKRPVRIRLRLRPWLADTEVDSDFAPGTPAYMAIHDYRAGVPTDDIAACVELIDAAPGLELVGLHAHITRQSTSPTLWSAYGRWMGDTAAQVASLARASLSSISQVNFGGGYAFPADPTGQSVKRRFDAPPTPAEVLSTMLGAFRERLDTHGISPDAVGVEIEPGRGIFGDAGVHLTSALHVKQQHTPVERTFVEVDTSEVFLADVVWEASRFEVVNAHEPSRPSDHVAAITGVSCGFDVLYGPEPIAIPKVGDVMAFLDTGAYQDSIAGNFNLLGRPPLVLVDNDTCRLARMRETFDDVIRRESDGIMETLS
jgi:diaminopimelate decarboxylase